MVVLGKGTPVNYSSLRSDIKRKVDVAYGKEAPMSVKSQETGLSAPRSYKDNQLTGETRDKLRVIQQEVGAEGLVELQQNALVSEALDKEVFEKFYTAVVGGQTLTAPTGYMPSERYLRTQGITDIRQAEALGFVPQGSTAAVTPKENGGINPLWVVLGFGALALLGNK